MTLNSAVDVAIGLILMYLVLSLICTTVNEYIATALKLRATTLADGIKKLIDDPVLHQAFSDHGLVDGTKAALGTRLPSYMDGRTFAMAILGSLDSTKPIPAFDDIKHALQHMADSNIRDTLLAQVVLASGDIQALRDNVAGWFDQTMERVGGAYKKTLKLMSLLVGLALAAIINADTMSVATALWRDPTLRTQLTDAASHAQLTAPGGDAALRASIASTRTFRPLPIGWHLDSDDGSEKTSVAWFWLQKVFGLVLTGIALSLGAPFWFDLLSKFMNVRGSGEKPKPTQS